MKNKNDYSEQLFDLARKSKFPHAVIIEDKDSARALNCALTVAKIVLCDSKNSKPCDKCKNCIKMNSKSHTDVTVIEPEKEGAAIKTETVRKIRQDAYVLSCEGKEKFYIITEADFMTIQAQNAFIKILEEPPKNVIFIIICKAALSLLSTVRSRCQIYFSSEISGANGEDDTEKLAQKIVDANSENDVLKIMNLISSAPNDRSYLKKLSEDLSEKLIYKFANSGIGFEKMDQMIDELSYLIRISNNNININLFKCRMMAVLIA